MFVEHPVAVGFTVLCVLGGLAALALLVRSALALRSGPLPVTGSRVAVVTILCMALWAVPGLIVAGDVAAVLSWPNPYAATAGIIAGAGLAGAVYLRAIRTDADGGALVALPGSGAAAMIVTTGVVGFVGAFLVTMLLKVLDPGLAA